MLFYRFYFADTPHSIHITEYAIGVITAGTKCNEELKRSIIEEM